jgi:hypothetical protein
MSLLVYGILETNELDTTGLDTSWLDPSGLDSSWLDTPGVGLEGRPLRAISEGPLVAVVSDQTGPDPTPTPAAVTSYERIVRRLMERGPVLPAQFGSVLADEAGVRGLLRRRRKDLMGRLDRVRGAVEIGLRASWRETGRGRPDVRPQSGTSYLRDRLELRQSARRVASELDALTALAVSSRRAVIPRPDLPVLDAYLVDRARVDEFVALVAQLGDCLDDVDLVCTGPWPPYSFAEGAPV